MSKLTHSLILVVVTTALPWNTVQSAAANETIIEGVVLDPVGQSLEGVDVSAVFLSHRAKDHPLAGGMVAKVAAQAKTNSDGVFQIKVRPFNASRDIALELFAYTKNHGVRFQYLEDAKARYKVTLKLPKELVLKGTLRSPDGDPLSNALLTLGCLRSTVKGEDNSAPFHLPPADFSAWPKELKTDADGSFSVRGVSSMNELELEINDARVARQRWKIAVDEQASEPLELQTSPPRKVVGTVVAGGGNEPIAEAIVKLTFTNDGDFVGTDFAETDSTGRFTVIGYLGNQLCVKASAPGDKFKPLQNNIPWIDGTTVQTMTLPLDHDGFHRLDGTTASGLPASTIESETPIADVVYLKPTQELTASLDGTLIIQGDVTFKGGHEGTLGVFAVNPNGGPCRTISENAGFARVSRGGRYLAANLESGSLQIITLDSEAPEIQLPLKIRDMGCRPAAWLPHSSSLILEASALKQKHYSGEGYWQEESDHWQLDLSNNQLRQIAVPTKCEVWDVSPDGKLLAMHWDTHSHVTGAQLFISSRDGSEVRAFARKREQYYWYPRFSPDGKTVLAKHLDARGDRGDREGEQSMSIRTIALDGSQECSIQIDENYEAETACWSPDGRYLAVLAYQSAAFSGAPKASKLFIVDAEGTQVTEVILENIHRFCADGIEWTHAKL